MKLKIPPLLQQIVFKKGLSGVVIPLLWLWTCLQKRNTLPGIIVIFLPVSNRFYGGYVTVKEAGPEKPLSMHVLADPKFFDNMLQGEQTEGWPQILFSARPDVTPREHSGPDDPDFPSVMPSKGCVLTFPVSEAQTLEKLYPRLTGLEEICHSVAKIRDNFLDYQKEHAQSLAGTVPAVAVEVAKTKTKTKTEPQDTQATKPLEKQTKKTSGRNWTLCCSSTSKDFVDPTNTASLGKG